MREEKTKIKRRERCQMDGVHTFERLETGGFPTPNMGRLAGVCVCSSRSTGCAECKKNKSVEASELSNL